MIKLLLILALGIFYVGYLHPQEQQQARPPTASQPAPQDDAVIIATAFKNRQSNLQVGGQGIVVKALKDDNDGHRHQRFILRLANGHTLLVAHNIELAPRIDDLRIGDMVAFYGEYEWNPKGGVLHWTHHDPHNTHPHGWLKHHGNTYQ